MDNSKIKESSNSTAMSLTRPLYGDTSGTGGKILRSALVAGVAAVGYESVERFSFAAMKTAFSGTVSSVFSGTVSSVTKTSTVANWLRGKAGVFQGIFAENIDMFVGPGGITGADGWLKTWELIDKARQSPVSMMGMTTPARQVTKIYQKNMNAILAKKAADKGKVMFNFGFAQKTDPLRQKVTKFLFGDPQQTHQFMSDGFTKTVGWIKTNKVLSGFGNILKKTTMGVGKIAGWPFTKLLKTKFAGTAGKVFNFLKVKEIATAIGSTVSKYGKSIYKAAQPAISAGLKTVGKATLGTANFVTIPYRLSAKALGTDTFINAVRFTGGKTAFSAAGMVGTTFMASYQVMSMITLAADITRMITDVMASKGREKRLASEQLRRASVNSSNTIYGQEFIDSQQAAAVRQIAIQRMASYATVPNEARLKRTNPYEFYRLIGG